MTDQTRTLPNWASVKILDGGLCTQVAEKREYSSNINEECVRAWGRGDRVHFPPLANLNQAFGRWKKQASEKMARVTQKKKTTISWESEKFVRPVNDYKETRSTILAVMTTSFDA